MGRVTMGRAMRLVRTRLFAEWLCIFAAALLLVWWSSVEKATQRLDNALLDRLAAATASPADDGIVVIAIDDRSLAQAGRWPWSRVEITRMIDRITEARPRAILLDVLFTEPSTPQDDAALAGALERSGRTALPFALTPAEGRAEGTDVLAPIPPFARAVLATGHVVVTADDDGIVRNLAPELRDPSGRVDRHLVLALSKALGQTPRTGASPVAMQLRSSGAYRSLPASSVLQGEVPAQFLKDKVVMIGATAPGLGDLFPVPASAGSSMSGVELQANLFQDLAEGGFIEAMPAGWPIALSCLWVTLLFVGFWRLRPAFALWLALALALAVVLASLVLALGAGMWFPPGPVLLAFVAAYPLWGWRRLAAVSDFLDAEARKLEPAAGTAGSGSFSGFDSVAQQVSRLDFLVTEVSDRSAFLRRIIEATPDALCAFDAEGGLLLMNGRAEALLGSGRQGRSLHQLLDDAGWRAMRDGNEWRTPDGRIFVITRTGACGEPTFGNLEISILSDITAARAAETERRQMLEFLTHDMRAPQVAILSLASHRAHDEDETARFGRIRDHARRTMNLAESFVQLARLDEIELDLAEIDAAMLIEEARDRSWAAARDAKASITVALPAEPVLLLADGEVLSRMLDNLIGNAIKYGGNGVAVRMTLEYHARQAVFTVEDNGPGLPDGRQSAPFQRFGPKDKQGLGLGLAFVAEAVRRHGGTIVCSTAPGRGTSFRVELPVPDGINAG